MRIASRRALPLFALLVSALAALGVGPCSGNTIVVKNGESIQDAVDAALPGDIIVVRAGRYTAPQGADAVVTVMKSDITLIGNKNAVIDATGVDYGVRMGSRQGGCLLGNWTNFAIDGFTFENAGNSGLLIANVDGYAATHGTYLDNAEYGPYPVCSTGGYIGFNYAARHNDAAIYVGQSNGALIEHNKVEDSTIGVEVENSSNVRVRHNTTRHNTAGIFVVVLPNLNQAYTDHVTIEHNVVMDNNRDNPASFPDDLALLPIGSGILNVGGDDIVIRQNVVEGNDSFGIASTGDPFWLLDMNIGLFVQGLRVVDNVLHRNGLSPDPLRALTPGADIVFSADALFPPSIPFPTIVNPTPFADGNCFAGNVYETEYVEAGAAPGATLADFPCP